MNLRIAVLFSIAALVFTSTSLLAAAERWPAVRVGEDESEQRIRAELDKVTDLNFHDVALGEVINYLSEFHKIPIVFDRRALADQGVTDQLMVNVNLTNVKLRSALALMLNDLELDYVIRDDVLIITSPDVAAETSPICLFDVAPLAATSEQLDTLLSTVQSYAQRDRVPITMFRNVMLVKGNERQQDDIAAFLAALFQAQSAQQATIETTPAP